VLSVSSEGDSEDGEWSVWVAGMVTERGGEIDRPSFPSGRGRLRRYGPPATKDRIGRPARPISTADGRLG
jgi:hypothetical protein